MYDIPAGKCLFVASAMQLNSQKGRVNATKSSTGQEYRNTYFGYYMLNFISLIFYFFFSSNFYIYIYISLLLYFTEFSHHFTSSISLLSNSENMWITGKGEQILKEKKKKVKYEIKNYIS